MGKKKDYTIVNLIGEGSFGKVYKAYRDNKFVAIKQINIKNKSLSERQSLYKEIDINKRMKHDSIVQVLDYFEEKDSLFLVTELGEMDLYQVLLQDDYILPDKVKLVAQQLVSALLYMHSENVMHRDLKPQNIIIFQRQRVKLCDFGFASELQRQSMVMQSPKGTPLYMAPELLEDKQYCYKADMWSLGVVLYELATGKPPIMAKSVPQLISRIQRAQISYEHECFCPSFQNFLQRLLEKNPRKRADVHEISQHPYLHQTSQENQLEKIQRISRNRFLETAKSWQRENYEEKGFKQQPIGLMQSSRNWNQDQKGIRPGLPSYHKSYVKQGDQQLSPSPTRTQRGANDDQLQMKSGQRQASSGQSTGSKGKIRSMSAPKGQRKTTDQSASRPGLPMNVNIKGIKQPNTQQGMYNQGKPSKKGKEQGIRRQKSAECSGISGTQNEQMRSNSTERYQYKEIESHYLSDCGTVSDMSVTSSLRASGSQNLADTKAIDFLHQQAHRPGIKLVDFKQFSNIINSVFRQLENHYCTRKNIQQIQQDIDILCKRYIIQGEQGAHNERGYEYIMYILKAAKDAAIGQSKMLADQTFSIPLDDPQPIRLDLYLSEILNSILQTFYQNNEFLQRGLQQYLVGVRAMNQHIITTAFFAVISNQPYKQTLIQYCNLAEKRLEETIQILNIIDTNNYDGLLGWGLEALQSFFRPLGGVIGQLQGYQNSSQQQNPISEIKQYSVQNFSYRMCELQQNSEEFTKPLIDFYQTQQKMSQYVSGNKELKVLILSTLENGKTNDVAWQAAASIVYHLAKLSKDFATLAYKHQILKHLQTKFNSEKLCSYSIVTYCTIAGQIADQASEQNSERCAERMRQVVGDQNYLLDVIYQLQENDHVTSQLLQFATCSLLKVHLTFYPNHNNRQVGAILNKTIKSINRREVDEQSIKKMEHITSQILPLNVYSVYLDLATLIIQKNLDIKNDQDIQQSDSCIKEQLYNSTSLLLQKFARQSTLFSLDAKSLAQLLFLGQRKQRESAESWNQKIKYTIKQSLNIIYNENLLGPLSTLPELLGGPNYQMATLECLAQIIDDDRMQSVSPDLKKQRIIKILLSLVMIHKDANFIANPEYIKESKLHQEQARKISCLLSWTDKFTYTDLKNYLKSQQKQRQNNFYTSSQDYLERIRNGLVSGKPFKPCNEQGSETHTCLLDAAIWCMNNLSESHQAKHAVKNIYGLCYQSTRAEQHVNSWWVPSGLQVKNTWQLQNEESAINMITTITRFMNKNADLQGQQSYMQNNYQSECHRIARTYYCADLINTGVHHTMQNILLSDSNSNMYINSILDFGCQICVQLEPHGLQQFVVVIKQALAMLKSDKHQLDIQAKLINLVGCATQCDCKTLDEELISQNIAATVKQVVLKVLFGLRTGQNSSQSTLQLLLQATVQLCQGQCQKFKQALNNIHFDQEVLHLKTALSSA